MTVPTVLLFVDGMDGPDAEARVLEVLRSEPGVLGAVASHGDGCVEIEIDDDRITFQRLIELIETAGYRAELGG